MISPKMGPRFSLQDPVFSGLRKSEVYEELYGREVGLIRWLWRVHLGSDMNSWADFMRDS